MYDKIKIEINQQQNTVKLSWSSKRAVDALCNSKQSDFEEKKRKRTETPQFQNDAFLHIIDAD